MAWRAGTHHDGFNAGTMIAVFHEPWLDEEEPGVPSVGETIALMFPSRTQIKLTVIAASEDEMVVQPPGNTKWQMKRLAPKEAVPAPDTAGAPASFWLAQGLAK
jgi:hypothetical protein